MAKPPEESKIDKLKQFLGFNRSGSSRLPLGGASVVRTAVKEYILNQQIIQELQPPHLITPTQYTTLPLAVSPMFTNELFQHQTLKDLSRPNALKHRLKCISQLSDVVLNKRLEENGAEVLWQSTRDILKLQTSQEERQTMLRFLHSLIKGQYDQLDMMRVVFFRALQEEINLPEDAPFRFELFQALTLNGKDLEFGEDTGGEFVLDLMRSLTGSKKLMEFMPFLVNVMKNNNGLRENIVADIVLNTCCIATSSSIESDAEVCLNVLDAVLTFCYVPSNTLPQFVSFHCYIVNKDKLAQQAWTLMRKLLETRLGHSTIYVMCHLLQEKSNATSAGAPLMRGAIFFIGMALWGSKRVPSLKHPASSVLPSFIQALVSSNSAIVVLEVVLTIHRLTCKFGGELDSLTWDLVLDVVVAVVRFVQTEPSCPANIRGAVHELLTSIETLYERGEFLGSADRLFVIVEACAAQRPESSVLKLIGFRVKTLTPLHNDWIKSLKELVDTYFVHSSMPAVRVRIIEMLSGLIRSTSTLYRGELIDTVVLPYVTVIDGETDYTVRLKVVQLVIDLAETCESDRFYELLDVIKKVLDSQPSPDASTDATDKNVASHSTSNEVDVAVNGLLNIFKKKLYQLPAEHTIGVFQVLVSYAGRLLTANSSHPIHQGATAIIRPDTQVHHVATATTSVRPETKHIRRELLECLMSLRADTNHRVGLLIDGCSEIQFSPYIVCQPREVINRCGAVPLVSNPLGVAILPYEDAFRVVRMYAEQEVDWTVLQFVLEKLPRLLQNKTLLSAAYPGDVEKLCSKLCKLLSERNYHECLTNAPTQFTKSDFQTYIFPVLTCLVSFNFLLDKTRQAELVHSLEYGLVSKCARMCVRALTVCSYEIRIAVMRQLPSILHKLSQIQSTVSMAIPVIELLSSLIHLPELYSNFVEEQYMSVFAIAVPYTNPFKYSHYTVSLAYHVIAMWFIKCRLPFRRGFVKYIVRSLKVSVLRQIEELQSQKHKQLSAKLSASSNQDSSDRNRAQSLNEEALRSDADDVKRKANRLTHQHASGPSVTVKVDEPTATTASTPSIAAVPDHNVAAAFHKELLDTCIDMLSRYSYFTSGNLPKRSPVAKFLLAGGQSQSWLLGNSVITVTTSGGGRVSRSGLCEKCLGIARAASGGLNPSSTDESAAAAALRRRHKSEAVRTRRGDDGIAGLLLTPLKPLQSQDDIGLHRRSTSNAPSDQPDQAPTVVDTEGPVGLEARKKAMDNVLIGLKAQPSDHSVFTTHVCNCWCTHWAELHIRRPTGNFSWMMRLQNEQDLMTMFPDFLLSDISNLFMPIPGESDTDSASDPLAPEPLTVSSDQPAAVKLLMPEGDGTGSTEVHRSSSSPVMMPNDSVSVAAQQSDIGGDAAPKLVQRSSSVSGTSTENSNSARRAARAPAFGDEAKAVSFTSDVSSNDVTTKRDSGTRHRSGILSSVSEESDLVPLTQSADHSSLRKIRHSSGSSGLTTVQGGINPCFVFLQIFQNQCFRNKPDQDDPLLPMPINETTTQSIARLDMISPFETHKLGVIYIKPGQTKNEAAILANLHGSPRYMDFIQKLGDVVRLSECDQVSTYVGGMDHRTDGPFVYVWHSDFMQVVFHIATLMPCSADDPQCTGKKLHIGNDYASIVYNDSGEDYRMGTIKSQFNFVNIMIQPLDQGTNCVTVQTKPEIEDMIGHTDTKIISDANLALLVRQMAVHANLASMIYVRQKVQPLNPYASNWLERLRWIRTVRERLVAERAKSEPTEVRSMASTSKPIVCDDFSDFIK